MKNFVYIGFRVLALCIAMFFVVSSAANIAGWVPYSMDPPPSRERIILGSLPFFAFAVLLVLPYGKLGFDWLQKAALCALSLATLVAVVISLHGIFEGIRGTRDWRIIPTMGVFAAILVGNYAAIICKLRTNNFRSEVQLNVSGNDAR